jgi:hypothetical protein
MPSWRGLLLATEWIWMHEHALVDLFMTPTARVGGTCIAWNEI